MSIIKQKINMNYTCISNQIFIDKRLTDLSVRVYCYLVSRPDDWQVHNKDIMNNLNIKTEKRLADAWKMLLSTGWLQRVKKTSSDGKWSGGYDYEIFHNPIDITVSDELPNHAKTSSCKTPDQVKHTDCKTPEQVKHRAIISTEYIVSNECNNTDYIINTDNKKTTSQKSKIKDAINAVLNDDIFSEDEKEKIKLWFEQKDEMKQYKTSQAVKMFKTELLKFKENNIYLVDILEQGIANQWKGITYKNYLKYNVNNIQQQTSQNTDNSVNNQKSSLISFIY